eukprot:g21612.t1
MLWQACGLMGGGLLLLLVWRWLGAELPLDSQHTWVVVTGAASGIGREVVLQLLRETRCGVFAWDRDSQGLAALAAEVSLTAQDNRLQARQVDVTDQLDVQRAAQHVEAHLASLRGGASSSSHPSRARSKPAHRRHDDDHDLIEAADAAGDLSARLHGVVHCAGLFLPGRGHQHHSYPDNGRGGRPEQADTAAQQQRPPGCFVVQSGLEESVEGTVRPVFEVNVLGAMSVNHFLFPLLLAPFLTPPGPPALAGSADSSPCIVLLSSLSARLCTPGAAIYAASKAALSSYANSLACEVRGSGLRVACLEPGIVATPMSAQLFAPAARFQTPANSHEKEEAAQGRSWFAQGMADVLAYLMFLNRVRAGFLSPAAVADAVLQALFRPRRCHQYLTCRVVERPANLWWLYLGSSLPVPVQRLAMQLVGFALRKVCFQHEIAAALQ